MGIEQVLTAPRSPSQDPYSKWLDGSIRHECLDHVVVFGEGHLGRILKSYVEYYNRYRTHLSLEMDTPEARAPHCDREGKVVSVPHLGGFRHHYERPAG